MSTADPGLQPERTALARHRTSLACTAAGVVTGLAWLRLDAPVPALLAVLVGTAAGVRVGMPGPPGRDPSLPLAVAVGCAVVLAALGVAACVRGLTV